jgi:hypothetical protein
VVVKAIRSQSPQRVTVTLAADEVSIAAVPLMPGSIVVASDSSLGTVYSENVDYVIDCAAAKLIRRPGGALIPGQSVTVWCVAYTLLESGQDYALDAAKAEFRRIGSTIAPGETVYVDYAPLYLDLSDELVHQAVTTANGMVENEVDPAREFEADPMLTAAATDRALEILCRAAASRELSSRNGADKSALAWLKLAEGHAARANDLLRAFHPPLGGPRGPVSS